jgi:putative sterol carrier protein
MTVVEGEIVKNGRETEGMPDVVIETDSETLCDMFWGDINPTQKYLKGEIKVKGSQEDVMRIDAITAVIWPEV